MSRTARSDRVLLLTLSPREAQIAQDQLGSAGITAHVCRDVEDLCQEMEAGAGASLLAEEHLQKGSRTFLEAALARQPPWSDFPLLVVANRRGRGETNREPLEGLGNVTLLDPPLRIRTMIRAARSALRGRRRQYAAREAIVERDRFLAMLGHELRNPLSALALATEVASQEKLQDKVEHLPLIRRQIEHLTRLVDDLLDVARVTSGRIHLRVEPVRLDLLVRDATSSILDRFHRGRVELTLELEEALWVAGDPVRLEQMVTNLLTNAVKYTSAGGHVRVRCWKEGSDAMVSVLDDGAGISAELLPQLFEQFVQGEHTLDRAQGGLGVGLALVRTLVELHGGAVLATSPGRGEGSDFRLRIPLLQDAERPTSCARQPTEAAAERGTTRRVLLVEDNEDARELLALTLREAGHEVAEAADGEDGLRCLAAAPVDVAIVDLGLPRIDGFEVARRARQQHGANLFLIALSGYGQPQDQHAALEAGFDLHLTKPTNLARLQAILTSLNPAGDPGARSGATPGRRL